MQVKVQKSIKTTLPCRPAAVNGGELSQSIAPAREGNKPSTGNRTAAGCVVARRSWLALLKSVFQSFASWAICLSTRKRDLDDGSAQRPERRPELLAEDLRLLPGGKVAALVDFVEVDEVGVGLLCPAAGRLILLAGKDRHGDRNGDALGVEEAALVLPIEARRGNGCVRQPIERDVVEHLVTRQFAHLARRPIQSRGNCRGRLAVGIVVVEQPGGQPDG